MELELVLLAGRQGKDLLAFRIGNEHHVRSQAERNVIRDQPGTVIGGGYIDRLSDL